MGQSATAAPQKYRFALLAPTLDKVGRSAAVPAACGSASARHRHRHFLHDSRTAVLAGVGVRGGVGRAASPVPHHSGPWLASGGGRRPVCGRRWAALAVCCAWYISAVCCARQMRRRRGVAPVCTTHSIWRAPPPHARCLVWFTSAGQGSVCLQAMHPITRRVQWRQRHYVYTTTHLLLRFEDATYDKFHGFDDATTVSAVRMVELPSDHRGDHNRRCLSVQFESGSRLAFCEANTHTPSSDDAQPDGPPAAVCAAAAACPHAYACFGFRRQGAARLPACPR